MISREVSTFGNGGQLGATLRLMDKLIHQGSIDPKIVTEARRACGKVKGNKPESRLVWERVKDGVTYRKDPHGVEWVQDAATTLLGEKAGDCDDQAVCAGAMLQSMGHRCIPVAVQWKGRNKPSHAVVLDLHSGMIVDPVGPEPDIWPGNREVSNLYTISGNQRIVGGGEMGTLDGFFSINSWKKALHKINSKISHAILPKPLQKIEAKISGSAERLDRSVSKDFAKAKKWSQDHRKTLQIVAAVAGAAFGAYFLLPSVMGAGAAVEGGALAAEGGAAAAGASTATAAAATTASGSGFWATVGTKLATTLATSTIAGALKPKAEAPKATALPPGMIPYTPGMMQPDPGMTWGGFSGGGGGGGGMGGPFPNVGPDNQGMTQGPQGQEEGISPLMIAAGLGLIYLIA